MESRHQDPHSFSSLSMLPSMSLSMSPAVSKDLEDPRSQITPSASTHILPTLTYHATTPITTTTIRVVHTVTIKHLFTSTQVVAHASASTPSLYHASALAGTTNIVTPPFEVSSSVTETVSSRSTSEATTLSPSASYLLTPTSIAPPDAVFMDTGSISTTTVFRTLTLSFPSSPQAFTQATSPIEFPPTQTEYAMSQTSAPLNAQYVSARDPGFWTSGVITAVVLATLASIFALSALVIVLVKRKPRILQNAPKLSLSRLSNMILGVRAVRASDSPLRLPSATPSELEAYTRAPFSEKFTPVSANAWDAARFQRASVATDTSQTLIISSSPMGSNFVEPPTSRNSHGGERARGRQRSRSRPPTYAQALQ
ncbi:hypothetical protein C8Q80DRAFT_442695 [Daedaleopsis nitida]|nr:hypothetical protein C8Q80DRAFT_442695 [Daedaleopsis nitida]